jgi:AraC-like DNA-binding protein
MGCNIKEWLHPLSTHVYAVAIERALTRPNVATIARLMLLSTRHLERRFEEATLPAPQRLVILARWIPVADLLRTDVATGEISRSLRFASTQAFCRAVHRELRMSIRELRDPDATSWIARDLVTAYQDPTRNEIRRKMATTCRESTTSDAEAMYYYSHTV